ncbi:MAG: TonB family protein [Tahibacter sp.]
MSFASLLLTFASVVPAGEIYISPSIRQVYARVEVSEDGRIDKVRFRNRMSEIVETALRERVLAWTFDPVMKDGVGVRATAILHITVDIERADIGLAGLTITDVIHAPEPVHTAAPEFTPRQADAGLRGLVVIRCHINYRGRCKDLGAVPSDTPPVLVSSALKAMAEWRFEPEFVGGAPVDTWLHVPFCFGETAAADSYHCPAPPKDISYSGPDSPLQFHWEGPGAL